MMRRFGLLSILFCLALFSIFFLLSKFYDSYFSNPDHWVINEVDDTKQFWIMKKQNESYDFAFIGSSRTFNMIAIDTIETLTSLKGINLACSGTGYPEEFLLLSKFLGNNNHIGTLFICADIYNLKAGKEFAYPLHYYRYMPFLDDSLVCSVFKDNSPKIKFLMWRYVPFAKYAEFNNYYSVFDILLPQETSTNFYDERKGSKLVTEPPQLFLDGKPVAYRYNVMDFEYLKKLTDLALQHNLRVVYYNPPEYTPLIELQTNRNFFLRKIDSLATTYKIPFLNFEDDSICLHKEYFQELVHMNEKGTLQFSALIAANVDSLTALSPH